MEQEDKKPTDRKIFIITPEELSQLGILDSLSSVKPTNKDETSIPTTSTGTVKENPLELLKNALRKKIAASDNSVFKRPIEPVKSRDCTVKTSSRSKFGGGVGSKKKNERSKKQDKNMSVDDVAEPTQLEDILKKDRVSKTTSAPVSLPKKRNTGRSKKQDKNVSYGVTASTMTKDILLPDRLRDVASTLISLTKEGNMDKSKEQNERISYDVTASTPLKDTLLEDQVSKITRTLVSLSKERMRNPSDSKKHDKNISDDASSSLLAKAPIERKGVSVISNTVVNLSKEDLNKIVGQFSQSNVKNFSTLSPPKLASGAVENKVVNVNESVEPISDLNVDISNIASTFHTSQVVTKRTYKRKSKYTPKININKFLKGHSRKEDNAVKLATHTDSLQNVNISTDIKNDNDAAASKGLENTKVSGILEQYLNETATVLKTVSDDNISETVNQLSEETLKHNPALDRENIEATQSVSKSMYTKVNVHETSLNLSDVTNSNETKGPVNPDFSGITNESHSISKKKGKTTESFKDSLKHTSSPHNPSTETVFLSTEIVKKKREISKDVVTTQKEVEVDNNLKYKNESTLTESFVEHFKDECKDKGKVECNTSLKSSDYVCNDQINNIETAFSKEAEQETVKDTPSNTTSKEKYVLVEESVTTGPLNLNIGSDIKVASNYVMAESSDQLVKKKRGRPPKKLSLLTGGEPISERKSKKAISSEVVKENRIAAARDSINTKVDNQLVKNKIDIQQKEMSENLSLEASHSETSDQLLKKNRGKNVKRQLDCTELRIEEMPNTESVNKCDFPTESNVLLSDSAVKHKISDFDDLSSKKKRGRASKNTLQMQLVSESRIRNPDGGRKSKNTEYQSETQQLQKIEVNSEEQVSPELPIEGSSVLHNILKIDKKSPNAAIKCSEIEKPVKNKRGRPPKKAVLEEIVFERTTEEASLELVNENNIVVDNSGNVDHGIKEPQEEMEQTSSLQHEDSIINEPCSPTVKNVEQPVEIKSGRRPSRLKKYTEDKVYSTRGGSSLSITNENITTIEPVPKKKRGRKSKSELVNESNLSVECNTSHVECSVQEVKKQEDKIGKKVGLKSLSENKVTGESSVSKIGEPSSLESLNESAIIMKSNVPNSENTCLESVKESSSEIKKNIKYENVNRRIQMKRGAGRPIRLIDYTEDKQYSVDQIEDGSFLDTTVESAPTVNPLSKKKRGRKPKSELVNERKIAVDHNFSNFENIDQEIKESQDNIENPTLESLNKTSNIKEPNSSGMKEISNSESLHEGGIIIQSNVSRLDETPLGLIKESASTIKRETAHGSVDQLIQMKGSRRASHLEDNTEDEQHCADQTDAFLDITIENPTVDPVPNQKLGKSDLVSGRTIAVDQNVSNFENIGQEIKESQDNIENSSSKSLNENSNKKELISSDVKEKSISESLHKDSIVMESNVLRLEKTPLGLVKESTITIKSEHRMPSHNEEIKKYIKKRTSSAMKESLESLHEGGIVMESNVSRFEETPVGLVKESTIIIKRGRTHFETVDQPTEIEAARKANYLENCTEDEQCSVDQTEADSSLDVTMENTEAIDSPPKKRRGRKPKSEYVPPPIAEKFEFALEESQRGRKRARIDYLEVEGMLAGDRQTKKRKLCALDVVKVELLNDENSFQESGRISTDTETRPPDELGKSMKSRKYTYTGETTKMISNMLSFAGKTSDTTSADNNRSSQPFKRGRPKKYSEETILLLCDDQNRLTCSLCREKIAVDEWDDHNEMKHYRLSWREGEAGLILDSDTVVKNILKPLLQKHKQLVCVKCNKSYTKVQEFVVHREECEGIVSNGEVICAVCNVSIVRDSWLKHKVKHNNLAWRVGDPALDLTNESTVLTILNALHKAKKKLQCEKCNDVKKSVIGYLSHRSQCGSEGDAKIACEICGRRCLPVSMPTHIKMVHNTPKNIDSTHSDYFDIDMDATFGRRRAATKALDKIDEFTRGEQLQYFRYYIKQLNFEDDKTLVLFLNKELEDKGSLKCKVEGCEFVTEQTAVMLEHLTICPLRPTDHYTCIKCYSVYSSDTKIIQHLKSVHRLKINPDVDYEQQNRSDDGAEDLESIPMSERMKQVAKLKKDSKLKKEDDLSKPKPWFILHTSRRNRDRFSLYSHAFKYMFQFCRTHYIHNNLFENLKCNLNDWDLVEEECLGKYLPPSDVSCDVARKIVTGFENVYAYDYTFKKFEMFEVQIEDGQVTIFCGGPVLCLAWLPTPYTSLNQPQILAVAVGQDFNGKYTVEDFYNEQTIVQFWSFGTLKNCQDMSEPKFEFGLAFDNGPIWHLEWCPSGCFNAECSEEWSRMGLLAVAGSTMPVNIYSIPLLREDKTGLFYKVQPALKLQLVVNESELKRKIFPTKLSWNKIAGSTCIAVGYTDGNVAVYNVKTNSNLLLFKDENSVDVLLPYKIIKAHTHYVSVLSWIPVECNRWLLTASFDKNIFVWDLFSEDKLGLKKSKILTDGAWLTHWLSHISITEESTPVTGTVVTSQNFHRGYLDDNINLSNSTTSIYSISANDWLNGFVHANTLGEINSFFPHQMFYCQELLKKGLSFRFLEGYTKLIDKTKLPEERPLIEKKKQEILKPRPRKSSSSTLADYMSGKESYNMYEPLDYQEAIDQYGVVFCDIKPTNPCPLKWLLKNSDFSKPHLYPLQEVNKICFNPNRQASLYFATGYQIGFVRLTYLKHLEEDDQVVWSETYKK